MSKQTDIQYIFYIQLQLTGNDMESEDCSYTSLALLNNVSDKKNAVSMSKIVSVSIIM